MVDSKDSKDSGGFFRKVVKFVANPATDWAQLGMTPEEAQESEYAKSELKAMIERKRRNDFVRKREFDMLRKVRREGFTGEHMANLGSSSRIDDTDLRAAENGAKPFSGVKAKIDEIEQQMVGDGLASPSRRAPAFYAAPTQPAPMGTNAPTTPDKYITTTPKSHPIALTHATASPDVASTPPASVGSTPKSTQDIVFEPPPPGESPAFALDPELDEAVIAFANADFELCEQTLTQLIAETGSRAEHLETWLTLFDFYRATGQQPKFESHALDYAQRFGWSAPQWFSMPKLLTEITAEVRRPHQSAPSSQVGWVCPRLLSTEGVAQLRSQMLQMPMPWVFDWGALDTVDTEACAKLSELLRHWMGQALDMQWLHTERLMLVLQEAAPTSVRDADPVFWQLRMDVLRMANRQMQFDEVAIDYCMTYEVSPPSWEPVKCHVRLDDQAHTTQSAPLSMISDVSTTFQESELPDEPGMVQVAGVELSGQLAGDIGAVLTNLTKELQSSSVVKVSCARLIRVDFIAAGDLLNWVLARRTEGRSVSFTDAHRLIALFFGAMGINEHAQIKVRVV